jgi:hypothetical protein
METERKGGLLSSLHLTTTKRDTRIKHLPSHCAAGLRLVGVHRNPRRGADNVRGASGGGGGRRAGANSFTAGESVYFGLSLCGDVCLGPPFAFEGFDEGRHEGLVAVLHEELGL